jgi:hypothetical protein
MVAAKIDRKRSKGTITNQDTSGMVGEEFGVDVGELLFSDIVIDCMLLQSLALGLIKDAVIAIFPSLIGGV